MRVAADRLTAAVISVMTALGADEVEARLVADSLITADLRGIHSHGRIYLPTIAGRIAAGHIDIPTRVEPIAADGAVVYLDDNNGLGQGEASRRLQLRGAILDSMGVCLFIRPAFVKEPELLANLLNARYGWDLTFHDVQQMGVECLDTEGVFNDLAGAGSDRCDVPEFMRDEALPPHNTVFDISETDMEIIGSIEPVNNQF